MSKEIAYYTIHLVYKDEEDLTVDHILPDQLSDFFEKLTTQGVYWNKNENGDPKSGFWTNLADVRYLTINAIEGEELKDVSSLQSQVEGHFKDALKGEQPEDVAK